jgi:hypothetical protein
MSKKKVNSMLRIRARRLFSFAVGAATFMSLAVATGPSVAAADPGPTPYPVNPLPVHFDVSPPLASMTPANYNFESVLGNDRGAKPLPKRSGAPAAGAPASPTAPSVSAPTPGVSFDGLGVGFGSYLPCCAPPDTNASVGKSDIVEVVNLDFAIWDKASPTPVLRYGPAPLNTLWSGFGGGCQVNNDGDPTVLYDSIADRWLISQFSVTTTPYLNCVAVSTSPDPTGSYYRYSYTYGNVDFIDYPKFGIWPDGYYVTFNVFANGVTFTGAKACVYDRTNILVGKSAAQQCFQTSPTWGGLLPSTLNGTTLPPTGTPNYVMALDAPVSSNLLQYWKFSVNWTAPASATFTGPTALGVAQYKNSCSTQARGDCIPQGGTTQKLESLADRLMYRLNYRNFGDHAALVVNHTIEVGSGSSLHSGVRWYEIRPEAGNLTLFQQGTYAPDANWRWMGSVNMDKVGNIAMGYSVSSSTLSPQIRVTGRLASDGAGMMTQGETTIITGASQTGGLARWGDYSSTAMDPVDDCTFFHANEYLKTTGSFNWSTRIASFTLPNCLTPATPDYSLSASPASQSVVQGAGTTYTVTVTRTGGFAGGVTMSVSGLPAGATATFSPNPTTTNASIMTVTTSATTPTGSYPLTITGTSGTLTHTTSVTLVVTVPPTPDFTISATPASQTVVQGSSTSYTVTATYTNAFTGTVTFSVSGLPTGAGATFNPPSVTTTGSSNMSVTTAATTPAGTYPLTITGTSGPLSRTASVSLVVTTPTPPNFSVSATPSSRTIVRGSSTTYTVTITPSGGFNSTVTFSVSGLGSGATGTFAPVSVTTSGSTTLTITTTVNAATGTFPLTITGMSGTLSHTAAVTLIINQGCINGDGEC